MTKNNPKSYYSSTKCANPHVSPRPLQAASRTCAQGRGRRGTLGLQHACLLLFCAVQGWCLRPHAPPGLARSVGPLSWSLAVAQCRLSIEKPTGLRYCTGEEESPGARTSFSDKDRSFMINSGRFKYLLS